MRFEWQCPCIYSDDDDINDVATMGGVNLSEESRNILSGGTELVGAQIRSCRDEPFFDMSVLNARIQQIGSRLYTFSPTSNSTVSGSSCCAMFQNENSVF